MNKKQLEELENCGRCQFTAEATALILQVDEGALRSSLADKESAAYRSYHRGRLMAEAEVRKEIIDLATRGSSQAQELFFRLRDELKVDTL